MRIKIMGVPVDALSMDQTVDKIIGHIERGELTQHMAINPGKVVRMMEDPGVRKTVRRCEVISADGIGFVWASRFLGMPLPERVTGIELMDRLLQVASERGLKPYFLGAKEEVVVAAVEHYQQKHPELCFAGYRNGYFKPEEEAGIADAIRDSGADMLFVAISSPKKEQFLGGWRDRMQVPYCMGVGGSFDVIAGKVDRAPDWMQRYGLEWSYRWIQEPRRMLRRNVVDTPKFLALALTYRLTGLEVPE
jgi:N-acetylglucosaminyldiphosphoundecaprenol N-acetyl-beta-D-mannosaminyltransferase